MLDFNTLFEFSRTHCVAICAFLVPFNLITTLATLILLGLHRPQKQVVQPAGLAIAGSTLMILHVMTWLLIRVVMAPTYVLSLLALCCLTLNLWAISRPQSLTTIIHWFVSIVKLMGNVKKNQAEAS